MSNVRLCLGTSPALAPSPAGLITVGLLVLVPDEFRLLVQMCPPGTRCIRFDRHRRNRQPVLTDVVQGTQWQYHFGAMSVLTFADLGDGFVLAMHHPSGLVEEYAAAAEELAHVHP